MEVLFTFWPPFQQETTIMYKICETKTWLNMVKIIKRIKALQPTDFKIATC